MGLWKDPIPFSGLGGDFQLLSWCCGWCGAGNEERSVPVPAGPARQRYLLTGQAVGCNVGAGLGTPTGVHRALHVLRESV